MVQPLDKQLVPVVERAGGRLIRDPRPGTAITRPTHHDWLKHARKQARRHRPRATVMFLGTTDAEPMRAGSGPTVRCCGRAWIDEYARRVGRMIGSYGRGGAGRVYWLTLPVPKVEGHARRLAAVNIAIRQAVAAAPETARVVDTIPAVSPGNRFRLRIRHRGRMVTVRERDGVHLSPAGARIVRGLVVRALRADGLL
jgi:hypothetical protein